ncbi:hypothetical protein GCM10023226_00100 [Nocardioides nanhaiensis]|uniref:Glycoprotein n=1 Tax=Nocardioides nanhaiensis TaxID=1476871 RepID=A0ABP8VN95_9ACTN
MAAGTLVLGTPATPAGAAPASLAAAPVAAPAAARYDPALELTIDTLSPSTLTAQTRGAPPVRITGTVTNVDDVPWRGVNLYPVVSEAPMTTRAELAAAAASDPELYLGERITDPGPYDTLEELAPGESQPYSLSLPRERIVLAGSGTYWLGVQALGETELDGRDDLSDGRARTFLPYRDPGGASTGGAGAVRTSLVLPLRRELAYAEDGSLDQPEQLGETLGAEGRLRALVDFAAAAGDRPVSVMVDPALPDAVRRLSRGNPPRSLAPTDPTPDDPDAAPSGEPTAAPQEEPTAGEGSTPSDEGDEAGGGDEAGEAGEAPELTEEQRATSEAATAWLGRFAAAVEDREVLVLPYGDLDLPAAAAHDPLAYDLARARTGRVLAELAGTAPVRETTPDDAVDPEEGDAGDEGDASPETSVAPPEGAPATLLPVAGAPSGYLDAAAVRLLEPGATALVTDEAFREEAPGVADLEGRRGVVTSSAVAAGGPGPGDRFTSLQLRQRLLAEALARSVEPGRPPLVVVMPQQWAGEDPTGFFAGLDDVPWLDLSDLEAATDREGREVAADELVYPARQARRELDESVFTSFADLLRAGETLQNLLTRNSEVASLVTDEGLTSLSYGARSSAVTARTTLARTTDQVRAELGQVGIDAGPGVTLSGSDGQFNAVVTNDLDQPITVGILATTTSEDGGVSVDPVEPLEMGPRSRATVLFDAHAETAGVTNVTLSLVDVEGNPLGATDRLPVRSAQVSEVIWLIIGTGLGLLFLAIAVRLVRRVRRATGQALPTVEPAPDSRPVGSTP